MDEINAVIQKFNLSSHPEGGYFKEVHRSNVIVNSLAHGGQRSAYTSIYFLLPGDTFSAWHRISSDETWFFHSGCDVAIHFFTKGKGMGFGDVELIFVIGIIQGFPEAFITIYLAFLFGGIFSMGLVMNNFLSKNRKKILKTKVAFGPFIIIAFFLVMFFKQEFLHFFSTYFTFYWV